MGNPDNTDGESGGGGVASAFRELAQAPGSSVNRRRILGRHQETPGETRQI